MSNSTYQRLIDDVSCAPPLADNPADSDTTPGRSDDSVQQGEAIPALVRWWTGELNAQALDAGALAEVVAEAHGARQVLDGLLVCCADRARELEASGAGPPAEETLLGPGLLRVVAARDHVAASAATDAFGDLGPVVRSGAARVESVQAVVRLWSRLGEAERERFVEAFDTELAERITALPPDVFAALVRRRGRAVRDDDGQADLEPMRAAMSLRRIRQRDGKVRYELEIDPLADEEFQAALESKARSTLHAHRDVDGRRRLDGHLRAEALLDLVRSGDNDSATGAPRPYALSIIVDHHSAVSGTTHLGTVCETIGQVPVPLGRLSLYACDPSVDSYHLDGRGRPFDHGHHRRIADVRQRRALRIQYPACPLSGTRFADCEIHHLDPWDSGGPTDYDNLIPVSRRWHHLVHDNGWRIVKNDDWSLDVHRPDGTHHKHLPPPQPVTRPSDSSAMLPIAA